MNELCRFYENRFSFIPLPSSQLTWIEPNWPQSSYALIKVIKEWVKIDQEKHGNREEYVI